MIELHRQDDALTALEGVTVNSRDEPGVSYAFERAVGEGGMAIAFFAERRSPLGQSPVVIKVMRPSFVREAGDTAEVIYQKEVTALERLNEKVPPTPFVVRLISTGVIDCWQEGRPVGLPWLVLEYVHGGAEGTTLVERVESSIRGTRFAFDMKRAGHAIECMSKGVQAVHDVGVLHRDLTPANVLCCGFGDSEIFKIVDFGIARPVGLAATFGGIVIGTPGYAAPEQAGLQERNMGPWTDVFGLAALTYFLLTGDEYFPAPTPMQGLSAVQKPQRRSITESRRLAPELAERANACDAIDRALARATSVRPDERPQSASDFLATVQPWLATDSKRPKPSVARLKSVVIEFDEEEEELEEQTIFGAWAWTTRHRPGDDRVIRSVAWDGDGHCLAATSEGLSFWQGMSWLPAPIDQLPSQRGIRFVDRMGPGRWLVGGDRATIAAYTADGVQEVVEGPDHTVTFEFSSGDFEDLAVVAGETNEAEPVLYAIAGRRWLKPLVPSDVAAISGIARLDDDRWLVVGRGQDGNGYAGVYSPLSWSIERVMGEPVRAFVACAAHSDRRHGLVVGSDGATMLLRDGETEQARLPDGNDLAAAAVDLGGRGWAGAQGSLWMRPAGERGQWTCVWRAAGWPDPIVSIFADVGLVIAVSATGGVIEGRSIQALSGKAGSGA